jgi:DNA helicase-2/ATP-dependent DNA helicase PcrA
VIVIDDEDAAFAARALGCVFEHEHLSFLKATSSCNVHACPGSGKTTLLVAKLAILARKWPWRDRGILVLSHTNVARREVEQRLATTPTSAGLLAYPHFIGTIQSFVDRFLALPFLRDTKVEEPRIDDDSFAVRAIALFFGAKGMRQYPQARQFLKNRRDGGRSVVASLHYKGSDLAIAASSPLPAPQTKTTEQLAELKRELSTNEAVFRYADMFALAASSMKKRPFVREAVRRRFPYVFFDEMQDTSKEQAEFLEDIFGGPDIVLHKLGDMNQAIFSESGDDSPQGQLSWASSLDLSRSQRLAPKLAELISPLAVVHPMAIQGNPKRQDRAHTVFVFDDQSITKVLPSFGDLILQEWGSNVPVGFLAKAVGFRRSPPEKPSIPSSLSDYYAGFMPRPADEPSAASSLIATVRHARRLVLVRGDYFVAHRLVVDAIARVLELHEGRRVTRRALYDRIKNSKLDQGAVRLLVSDLLTADYVSSAESWHAVVQRASNVLMGGKVNAEAEQYLNWEIASGGPSLTAEDTHLFIHSVEGKQVAIEVATIHAVKGETHDATLVLETFYYEHDVPLAIRLLVGESPPVKSARWIAHMKRLFVAASRPRELLCFAVHRAHVSDEQVGALKKRGWNVEVISAPVAPVREQ